MYLLIVSGARNISLYSPQQQVRAIDRFHSPVFDLARRVADTEGTDIDVYVTSVKQGLLSAHDMMGRENVLPLNQVDTAVHKIQKTIDALFAHTPSDEQILIFIDAQGRFEQVLNEVDFHGSLVTRAYGAPRVRALQLAQWLQHIGASGSEEFHDQSPPADGTGEDQPTTEQFSPVPIF